MGALSAAALAALWGSFRGIASMIRWWKNRKKRNLKRCIYNFFRQYSGKIIEESVFVRECGGGTISEVQDVLSELETEGKIHPFSNGWKLTSKMHWSPRFRSRFGWDD